MLKKTIFVLAFLAFAIGILFISVWRTSAQTLERQEVTEIVTSPAVIDEEVLEKKEEERVDYELTWPGILPDHFLYRIKMIRDRIWLWLKFSQVKKAELQLKFADKRIWAAQLLMEKGKADLAVSTASKAEKYLQQAFEQAKAAQEKGKEVGDLWDRLTKASLKHEEVLLDLREKVAGKDQSAIDELFAFPRRVREEIGERVISDQ